MKKIYYLREEKGDRKLEIKKTEVSSILISGLTLIVSIILFWITRNDVNSIRSQERNDFFAINMSSLKIEIADSNIFLDTTFVKSYSSQTDSAKLSAVLKITNISNYPVELFNILIDKYTSDSLSLDQIVLLGDTNLFSKQTVIYRDTKMVSVTILNNHSIFVRLDLGWNKYYDREILEYDFKLMYKNVLGGYYSVNSSLAFINPSFEKIELEEGEFYVKGGYSYEPDDKTIERFKKEKIGKKFGENILQYNYPLINERSDYIIYKQEEFPNIIKIIEYDNDSEKTYDLR